MTLMKTITKQGQIFEPSKIICIGRNYVDHINELSNEIPTEMVIFIKPNSAISNDLSSYHQEPLHYETELCFLYEQGRISAVGVGLDLTKRELQSQLKDKKLPWERAKAFNGSAVFSDFISLNESDNCNELTLELLIDGALKQRGGVDMMLHKPNDILTEIQTFLDLSDGDIIMTGTPKGVGQINKGESYLAKVLLNNKVLVSKTWQAL